MIEQQKFHSRENPVSFTVNKISSLLTALIIQLIDVPVAKGRVVNYRTNYADYLTPFELLFRDAAKLPVSDNILERLKVEIKREAFSSYDNYSFWDELNISKEEHVALKGLSANNDLIIQKSDKGNSVVLLNRNDYIKRLNEMLSDSSKFKKLNVKPGKEINFLLQQEDRLTNFLKKVKRSISEQLYKELYPKRFTTWSYVWFI